MKFLIVRQQIYTLYISMYVCVCVCVFWCCKENDCQDGGKKKVLLQLEKIHLNVENRNPGNLSSMFDMNCVETLCFLVPLYSSILAFNWIQREYGIQLRVEVPLWWDTDFTSASSNNAKCGVDGRTDRRVLPLLLYQHTCMMATEEGRRLAGDLQCKTGHLGRSRGEGTGAVANNKSCVPPPRSKPADEREGEREEEKKQQAKLRSTASPLSVSCQRQRWRERASDAKALGHVQ